MHSAKLRDFVIHGVNSITASFGGLQTLKQSHLENQHFHPPSQNVYRSVHAFLYLLSLDETHTLDRIWDCSSSPSLHYKDQPQLHLNERQPSHSHLKPDRINEKHQSVITTLQRKKNKKTNSHWRRGLCSFEWHGDLLSQSHVCGEGKEEDIREAIHKGIISSWIWNRAWHILWSTLDVIFKLYA